MMCITMPRPIAGSPAKNQGVSHTIKDPFTQARKHYHTINALHARVLVKPEYELPFATGYLVVLSDIHSQGVMFAEADGAITTDTPQQSEHGHHVQQGLAKWRNDSHTTRGYKLNIKAVKLGLLLEFKLVRLLELQLTKGIKNCLFNE